MGLRCQEREPRNHNTQTYLQFRTENPIPHLHVDGAVLGDCGPSLGVGNNVGWKGAAADGQQGRAGILALGIQRHRINRCFDRHLHTPLTRPGLRAENQEHH